MRSMVHSAVKILTDGLLIYIGELKECFRLDRYIAIIAAIFLALYVPHLARHTQDAVILATFFDDDALISMQLDGMATWPFGDPSNYLGHRGAPGLLPEYWHQINYQNLPYYGGFFLDIALMIWAPLKLVGFDSFPTVPIVLRMLTLVSSSLLIISVYNFGARHIGWWSGFLGSVYLATEYNFNFIGTVIHPDTFMFLLCVVGLSVALRYLQVPTASGLIALGIAAGLAQGAKMGGPLLIPATVLVIIFSTLDRLSLLSLRVWISVFRRGFTVFIVSIVVFLFTTPYAVLNSYFIDTWVRWGRQFSGESPISPTTFADWLIITRDHVGVPMILLAVAGAVLWINDHKSRRLPAVILTGTAVWSFLYYALFQKFWVQPQYLLLFYVFLGLFSFSIIDFFINWADWEEKYRFKKFSIFLCAAGVGVFFAYRLFNIFQFPIQYALWREASHYKVGVVSEQHNLVPHGSRILTDFPTYFDPVTYPDLVQNAGPIRYVDLARVLPDFLVMTRFNSNWQTARIAGPVEGDWEDHYANMKLYQQLFGRFPGGIDINEQVEFVKPLTSFGWARDANRAINWEKYPVLGSLRTFPILREYIDRQASRFLGGRHITLFEFDQSSFIHAMPSSEMHRVAEPFASSTAADANLRSLASGASAWRSARTGLDAKGEFAGLTYPIPVDVSEVRIRWIATHWLPKRIAVDYSDDQVNWSTAAEFHVSWPDQAETRTQGLNRWDEHFPLPPLEAHRSWRVRVIDISGENFFGMESIRISTRGK